MDQKLWLLVEWVDEQSVFSNYGVVNTHRLLSHETDLHTGKVVFLRDRRNNGARKAQILRISDNKEYIKELKIMLERQDNQVKTVLSVCVSTIKDMKTGPILFGQNQSFPMPCQSSTSVMSNDGDDTNSSDIDSDHEVNHDLNLTKSTIKYNNQIKRPESSISGQISRLLNDKTIIPSRRSLMNSTPLLDRNFLNFTLTFDQACQTDPVPNHPPLAKVLEMETVLKRLYMRFLSLLEEVQIRESRAIMNGTSEDRRLGVEVSEIEEAPADRQNNSSVELDVDQRANGLKIRRVSAQTTNNSLPMLANNDDMVAIGDGNATVPARLYADIDWSSYSTATRRLLQAVFPRRVLATHSLTGKQSPAFVGKPPKKQLDPKLVDDIVNTVSKRCGVSKRIVRSSITTKCTDEAKLYRNRQRYKKMREQNRENVPPSSPTSNESTAQD